MSKFHLPHAGVSHECRSQQRQIMLRRPCIVRRLQREVLQPLTGRSFAQVRASSGNSEQKEEARSWIPGWIRNKLPAALGGDREATALENMDLDAYATSLKRARQLGSLTGFVGGTSKITDPVAKGNLRTYEEIIEAMLPNEKVDLSLFGAASRRRVATKVGCTVAQVDDCIAKYEWMKLMTSKMAALKRQGKPLPKSVDEMERVMGNWRGHRKLQQQQHPSAAGPASTAGGHLAQSAESSHL